MLRLTLVLLALSSILFELASATRIPFSTRPSTSLRSLLSNSKASSADPFSFQNSQGQALDAADIYVATLSVGGKNFEVQLDTGSSDLWLDTTNLDISSFTNTGVTSTITYGDGSVASGPVLIANVTFGDFNVQQQAFISAPGSNATTNGDTGLLGVGPPSLSIVSADLTNSNKGSNSQTLIQNIFSQSTQNQNQQNLISFQLARSESTGLTSGGTFTIGEIDQTLNAVSNSPHLNVLESDRWVVFCDGVKVNGVLVNGMSAFQAPNQQPGQTLANLDTGTSLSIVPQQFANAIYGSIPGAIFSQNDGVFIVPCDAMINLTFVFGGQDFPVHPIDITVATQIPQQLAGAFGNDPNGIVCIGAFIPTPFADNSEDMILGDSFLRNVYSVFNFNEFITGMNQPTVQLLSTTDPTQAASQFSTLSAARNATLTGKTSSASGTSGQIGGTASAGGALPTPANSGMRTFEVSGHGFLSSVLLVGCGLGMGAMAVV